MGRFEELVMREKKLFLSRASPLARLNGLRCLSLVFLSPRLNAPGFLSLASLSRRGRAGVPRVSSVAAALCPQAPQLVPALGYNASGVVHYDWPLQRMLMTNDQCPVLQHLFQAECDFLFLAGKVYLKTRLVCCHFAAWDGIGPTPPNLLAKLEYTGQDDFFRVSPHIDTM